MLVSAPNASFSAQIPNSYLAAWQDETNLFTVIDAVSSTGNARKSYIPINVAGSGYRTKEGSNAKQGTGTLVSGTLVVANTSITTTSRIFLTRQGINSSTAIGELSVSSISAGTSFTVTAYTPGAVTTLAGDLSTFNYEIFEVAV